MYRKQESPSAGENEPKPTPITIEKLNEYDKLLNEKLRSLFYEAALSENEIPNLSSKKVCKNGEAVFLQFPKLFLSEPSTESAQKLFDKINGALDKIVTAFEEINENTLAMDVIKKQKKNSPLCRANIINNVVACLKKPEEQNFKTLATNIKALQGHSNARLRGLGMALMAFGACLAIAFSALAAFSVVGLALAIPMAVAGIGIAASGMFACKPDVPESKIKQPLGELNEAMESIIKDSSKDSNNRSIYGSGAAYNKTSFKTSF